MGQRHVCTFRLAQRAAYRMAISAAQTCLKVCAGVLCQVDDKTPLLRRREKLGQRVTEPTALRDDRLAQLRQLQAVEQELCVALSEKPCDIGNATVPSEPQLSTLRHRLHELQMEKVMDSCRIFVIYIFL